MSFSGSRPTQARKMLIKALRSLARALMTGVPGGVNGALSMKLKTLRTLWKFLNSLVVAPSVEAAFHWMRVNISAMTTRSMINGEARRESSQTLKRLWMLVDDADERG